MTSCSTSEERSCSEQRGASPQPMPALQEGRHSSARINADSGSCFALCSAVQATEVFAVAPSKLEEGRHGLTVRRLQAFQLQSVDRGEAWRVGVLIGGDFIFKHPGTHPLAEAGTHSLSEDRRPNVGWSAAQAPAVRPPCTLRETAWRADAPAPAAAGGSLADGRGTVEERIRPGAA